MADNTVSVDVELAIKKAQADLDKLSGRFDTFATKAEKSLGGVDKALGFVRLSLSNMAGDLAGKALLAVTRFAGAMVTQGIKAAQDYETALTDFNVALQLSGNYSAAASKSFEEFASAIQKTTKFSDDATLSAGALIANISGLGGKPLQDATKMAIDLAAALGKDLGTTAQLVGKVMAGETGTLSKYGIVISDTGTRAERTAAAIAALGKFSGAAEKQALTYAGATEQLKNAYGDLQKEVGKVLTQNPVVIEAIKRLSTLFDDLSGAVNSSQDGFKRLVGDGLVRFVYTSSLAVSWVDVLYRGLRFIYQFFDPFIQGLAAVGSALVLNFGQAGKFLEQAGKAVSDFNKNLFEETPLSALALQMESAAVSMQQKLAEIGKAEEDRKTGSKDKEIAGIQELGQWQQWYADLKKNAQKKDVDNTKSSLGVIAGLHSSNIKELFYIGKAAAIAQATINGFEAVTKAFAVAGPLGFVLGPLVAAATAAQIVGIAGQQPGFAQGGIVGGSSTTGDRVPIRVNSREAVLTLEQQQNLFDAVNQGDLGGGGVTIIVEGNVIADSPSRLDELADKLSDRVRFGNARLLASGMA